MGLNQEEEKYIEQLYPDLLLTYIVRFCNSASRQQIYFKLQSGYIACR